MTLLVLAAGMGSRYGGLKQIDPFTENGEFIIDFSVYDAIQAGSSAETRKKAWLKANIRGL